jgi:hypothetical protein
MRPYLAVYGGALTLLFVVGCAGSRRSHDTGTAPFDSVHIGSGDTLPPAHPDSGRAQPDTTSDSTGRDQTPT